MTQEMILMENRKWTILLHGVTVSMLSELHQRMYMASALKELTVRNYFKN